MLDGLFQQKYYDRKTSIMFELTNEELRVVSGGSRASANGGNGGNGGRGGRGGDAFGGLAYITVGAGGTISGNTANTTAGSGGAGGAGGIGGGGGTATAGDTTAKLLPHPSRQSALGRGRKRAAISRW